MDRGYGIKRQPHPKDTASIWSLLTFTYIYPYVRKGNKKDLTEDDMCKVWSKFQSKPLGDKIEKFWNEQKVEKGNKKSIFKLLIECYLKKYLLLGLFQLVVKIIYVVLTPHSVGQLVNYFKDGQTEITKNQAWMHGMIVIFTNGAYLFYEHHYILLKSEFGIDLLVSFSSLIYRKTIKLSPAKLAEISNGRIVTAITKDIMALEEACYFLNDLWVELIQAVVILYLLYLKLGSSALTGLSIIVFIVFLQFYVSLLVFKKRRSANTKTDVRLQLTQEVITAIRVLKMYAWEKFFSKKIIASRKVEIQKIRILTILKFLSSFLGNLNNKLSFLFVLLFYLWFGHNLTGEVVYYITTCFFRLRRTIAFIIPYCSGTFAELLACLRRLEFILHAEETEVTNQERTDSVIMPKVDFVSADIGVNRVPILKNINMKLKTGLNVLIGPVGCGKSSLLKAILREYELLNGKINVDGTISYSPQNPWIFPSSIKQNILFGQVYDETKYKTILEVCALAFDLDGLAEGDETILNDCGVNLSKGQQARVNIARTLYKDSDIYIFDDSLSSLDNRVKTYIFQYSIKNYLKDKLVILATHDKNFVDSADNVIIMLDGTVTYSGKPMDIPAKLSQSLESLDKDLCESDEENDNEPKEIEEEKPCNEDTELIAKICASTKANVYQETVMTGGIGWRDYKKYFTFGGGFKVFILVFAMYALVEALSGYSDKLLSRWVSLEEKIGLLKSGNLSNSSETESLIVTSFMSSGFTENPFNNTTEYLFNDTREDAFNTSNNEFETSTLIQFITNEIDNVTTSLSTKWEEFLGERMIYIYEYSFFLVTSCTLVFVTVSIYFVYSLKISKNLHKSMINNVLGAKMSFYDKNMSGNILNRFSKDLYCVDEWIPYIFNDAMRMICMMATTGVLIASVNTIFTVLTIVLITIFFFACRYCVNPGRTLRRLTNAARSPVVGHLNATLEGLITIRAYGTQNILIEEFDKHQDHFTAIHHLFEILMRMLSFTLHMVSAVYICIIILIFLIFDNDSSSNVGLAITQSFILSNFLDYGIRQWVMMESIMTNFQRCGEYSDIQQEIQTGQSVENWPSQGCIKFQNVSLTYRENNETVLKNLNFVIKPKEKIGIVGRTGAGKSSIIVTLFRLYEVEGDILIDDVNIKTLSLEYLRNHISIIPQDPILFGGTVRANVDPLNLHTDQEIWQALSAVNLKSSIKDLDEDIHETGITYSVGQRQLVCLARAIIRKTKIIILDEATANMDEETDQFIHNKIHELFEDCTTITVAHRLHSVMRCDRILVMDKGEIVEFDSPNALLENKDSMFYKMVHHHDS